MNIFPTFLVQNFSKTFSKTHQIASFIKIFSREHANAWQIPPLLQK